MATAYRFDDQKPSLGAEVAAFRSLEGLKRFINLQGSKGTQRFWKIQRNIINDLGGEDGLTIKVSSVWEVY